MSQLNTDESNPASTASEAGAERPPRRGAGGGPAPKEMRDSRKSAVRVLVTYIAAGFLFVVGSGFVAALQSQPEVFPIDRACRSTGRFGASLPAWP